MKAHFVAAVLALSLTLLHGDCRTAHAGQPGKHASTGEQEKRAPRRYENKVNRLSERDLQVIGQLAQDAVRWSGSHKSPIQGVRLRIAWTGLTKYDWNYVVPDVQRGRDDQSTQFPTVRDLFEKQLKAKTIFDIAIPDTPYSFKLVNGDVTPFFFDQEKYVLWQIVGLDREFHVMRKAATSSKTITFSAEGGDCEDLLTLDFSDRDHAPKITYYRRFDPP